MGAARRRLPAERRRPASTTRREREPPSASASRGGRSLKGGGRASRRAGCGGTTTCAGAPARAPRSAPCAPRDGDSPPQRKRRARPHAERELAERRHRKAEPPPRRAAAERHAPAGLRRHDNPSAGQEQLRTQLRRQVGLWRADDNSIAPAQRGSDRHPTAPPIETRELPRVQAPPKERAAATGERRPSVTPPRARRHDQAGAKSASAAPQAAAP